ncbi:hypothetical protein BpHYR1_020312 [Brachionus plicatilis]|uniref:Uncharacterized protein n=1 Tax=Brachionus plicatilis TaxID=10195 RepID=A0A3M7RXS5_BRAPC|nr:hypothetical protein BpHYR1_020312 [Brachionus plicatilis]
MPYSQHTISLRKSLDKKNIEMVHAFSTKNYGPFQYLNEIDPLNEDEHKKLVKNFKKGIYAIGKPKNESIEILHMDDQKPITVYRPFRFLIGEALSHNNKTSFLVFIPNPYLNELKNIQSEDAQMRVKELSDASKKHNEFFENFFNRLQEESQKVLDNLFQTTKLRDLALNGNRKLNLPNQIVEAIRLNKIGPNDQLPIGQFVAHEENVELPNGQVKKLVLTITTSFNGSTTQDYTEEDCYIKETTQNYSILYNLVSK